MLSYLFSYSVDWPPVIIDVIDTCGLVIQTVNKPWCLTHWFHQKRQSFS